MKITRREFIRKTFAGAAAATGILSLSDTFRLSAEERKRMSEAGENSYPILEASGSPEALGRALGKNFGENLKKAMTKRKDWFTRLKTYAEGEGRDNLKRMLDAAKACTPRAVEELKGWAEKSGVPFNDLLILNCNCELEGFMEKGVHSHPGCSTVALKEKDRFIVAHNEDGHGAYRDLMYVLKASPEKYPPFIALGYPVYIEGPAPALNSHGLILTTNYIGAVDVKPGIPRYFLARSILESKTIDEALEYALHPERSFSYHHIIASYKEQRVISVETTPHKAQVKEIEGLYLHTNHLILDEMKDIPRSHVYVRKSSTPRLLSLQKNLGSIRDISTITPDMIIKALSSHEGKP